MYFENKRISASEVDGENGIRTFEECRNAGSIKRHQASCLAVGRDINCTCNSIIRGGLKMKVRIYVQGDLTALVVPFDDVNKKLSSDKERMKASAIRTRDVDLDDSIIGVDRGGQRAELRMMAIL